MLMSMRGLISDAHDTHGYTYRFYNNGVDWPRPSEE